MMSKYGLPPSSAEWRDLQKWICRAYSLVQPGLSDGLLREAVRTKSEAERASIAGALAELRETCALLVEVAETAEERFARACLAVKGNDASFAERVH
jgi:hypothetical protein